MNPGSVFSNIHHFSGAPVELPTDRLLLCVSADIFSALAERLAEPALHLRPQKTSGGGEEPRSRSVTDGTAGCIQEHHARPRTRQLEFVGGKQVQDQK